MPEQVAVSFPNSVDLLVVEQKDYLRVPLSTGCQGMRQEGRKQLPANVLRDNVYLRATVSNCLMTAHELNNDRLVQFLVEREMRLFLHLTPWLMARTVVRADAPDPDVYAREVYVFDVKADTFEYQDTHQMKDMKEDRHADEYAGKVTVFIAPNIVWSDTHTLSDDTTTFSAQWVNATHPQYTVVALLVVHRGSLALRLDFTLVKPDSADSVSSAVVRK